MKIEKFATFCGGLGSELLDLNHTSELVILVSLSGSEVRFRTKRQMTANFRIGTLALSLDGPAGHGIYGAGFAGIHDAYGAMGRASKLTRNDSLVLEVLERASSPMTAYELLEHPQVRDAGLKAPLTVYRALDKLQRGGLVHRIESLKAFVACDHDHGATAAAAFMICGECKKTIETDLPALGAAVAKLADAKKFTVETASVEIIGRCADCDADRQETQTA